jgi:predicted aspartyl protease
MPESNAKLVQFPAGKQSIKLPAQIVYGDIIVRVNIGDRGLDFILDSGSSGIAIDSDVARQLGLTRFGESVETTAGSYIQTRAIVPDMRIGDIHLTNVMVDSLPFQSQENFSTKAVGLLGYDFIANAVLKIDYDHGTVEASLPDLFIPPAEGVACPAALDDGVPFIPVQIGNSTGDHFILDTGASDGVVFSTFADTHPDDLKDQGRGREISSWVPFVYSQGVGGLITMKTLEVQSLTVGALTFKDWLIFRTVANHAFEGEDTDGLIGYDFLKFFDVYLDYRQNMVYLVPNGLAKRNAGGHMAGE